MPAVLVEEAGTAGAGAGAGVAGGVGGTAGKVLVWVWFCVEVAVLCVCEVEVFKPELVGRETGVEEGSGGGSATDVLYRCSLRWCLIAWLGGRDGELRGVPQLFRPT